MRSLSKIMVIGSLSLFLACSKKKDGESNSGGSSGVSGRLLYDYAGKVTQIDLGSGRSSLFFGYNTYSTANWDLSQDGQQRLISSDETGTISTTIFKITEAPEGKILEEFKYVPKEGTGTGYSGTLSKDNSMILIEPDFYNGIVILNRKGEVLHQLKGINNEKLTISDDAIWMPDNSLLIKFKNKLLLRAAPPYTNLTLVKEMNYDSWGNLNTNRDGTKLSLYIGNHIHTMNADGSNMVQVTESESSENMAIFSPDDKHLLVGADYLHLPNTGSKWKLRIIPNNGKKYNLDTDPSVIRVKPVNENLEVTVSGRTRWVP